MGGLVLIVGPSGAGKDTLIGLARAALKDDGRFAFPKRLVTRPCSAFEDHLTIGEAELEEGLRAERYALAWRAHGLGYAVPASALDAAGQGRVVIVNVSRAVIDDARRRLGDVSVVEVTAPPEILAARLAARGRGGEDLDARLTRSAEVAMPPPDLRIVNDGVPEAAAEVLIAFLRARRAEVEGPAPQSPARQG